MEGFIQREELGGEIYQTMQLMKDSERRARGCEVRVLEEAALGREEGVPGCVCGIGRRRAEEGIVAKRASCDPYCVCVSDSLSVY